MSLEELIKLNKLIYGVEPKISKVTSYYQQGINFSVRAYPSKNFRNSFLLVDGHLELFHDQKELSRLDLASTFNYDKDNKLEGQSAAIIPTYASNNYPYANQIRLLTRYTYGNNQLASMYRYFRSELFIVPLNELTQNILPNGVKREVNEILYLDLAYFNDKYNQQLNEIVPPRVYLIEYDQTVKIW